MYKKQWYKTEICRFNDKKKEFYDNYFLLSTQEYYFYDASINELKMRRALKKQSKRRIIKLILTAKLNPWIGILVSLMIIIPSLYQILDDVTILRKEYLFFAIGFPLYLKSLKNLFDQILNPA